MFNINTFGLKGIQKMNQEIVVDKYMNIKMEMYTSKVKIEKNKDVIQGKYDLHLWKFNSFIF